MAESDENNSSFVSGVAGEFELSPKMLEARARICLPLDGLKTVDAVRERVTELREYVGMFKIGKELFTRFGPEVVSLVHSLGAEVFLDLKYHDIPNTVRGASYAAAELGVYMFNVHASGCSEMLEAAVTGAKDAVNYLGVRMPKVIGVTLLTSIDQKQLNGELGVNGTVSEYVMRLAKMSEQVGLDGIVCSAADLSSIKSELSDGFVYVTPGIKGVDGAVGSDQRRVMTPGNALQDGSSVLVIGRAITGYASPDERKMAAYKVLEDMAKYM